MKRKLEKRERKGKKRSKGIQASNHRRLQGLLISMILFLSLFIPSHIFSIAPTKTVNNFLLIIYGVVRKIEFFSNPRIFFNTYNGE